jgi:putative FmdB family regulatory protein
MPTYEYRCKDCGHEFEAIQSFSDDALTECPACQGALRKKFSAVGISFKGSGFYKTDSRGASTSTKTATPGSETPSGDSGTSSSTDTTSSSSTSDSSSGASSTSSASKPSPSGSSSGSSDGGSTKAAASA